MTQKEIAREDLDDISLEIFDELALFLPEIGENEQLEERVFDAIFNVLDRFFDQPDYRNYN